MPNSFVDVRQDLVYEYDWPSRLVRPIWMVKRAPKRAYPSFRRFSCAIAHHFLDDPNSDVKNVKFFRGRPSRPCLCIRLVITDCPAIWRVKLSPKRAYASFRRFSCAIAHHFLGDPDSDVKNAKCFRGRPSRPCLCIGLAIMACPTHLECQTSPEVSIPLISMIFVCYSTPFLGDPDFDVKKCQIFLWSFVKTLFMNKVGHHGLSDPFGGSNKPRSEHTPNFNDFRVL